MSFKWDESLTTGIAEIDRQHKELFKNMDNLLSALFRRNGKTELQKVMQFLEEDYIQSHFQNEESQMERYHYPDLTSHQQEHQEFLVLFQSLKSEFDSEGSNSLLAIQIHHKMDKWCNQHIKQVDLKLAEFLKLQSDKDDLT